MQQNDTETAKHYAQLEDFADNLLIEKDLKNIDEPTLRQMREDLVDRLEQVTNRVVVENLPDEKLPEFEQLIDQGADPMQIQEFVSNNVSELGPKLAEAYFDFRRLYLGL